ncbi:MAG: LysM peptidoglycan-binding domain-containing protein [Bacillota bacterium]
MKKYSIILFALISIFIFSFTTAASEYKVKPGDSLWKISNKYDIPIKIIIEKNDINNATKLYVGQKLIISSSNQTITINFDNEYSTQNNLSYKKYQVRSGDTLWKLAQKFNTTIERLKELNQNIGDNYQLQVGQKIIIGQKNDEIIITEPENNNSTTNTNNFRSYYFHELKEGETLWEIADHYGVRVSEIINENDIIDLKELETGDLLIIPLRNSSKFSYLKNLSSKVNNYYRVKSNESIADIAEFYNLSEKGIKMINNISENKEARIGQLLVMPVNPAFFLKHEIYTVKTNDKALHEIAYEKGLSIRSILRANYLKDVNAKFNKGKVLLIPLDSDSKATWIDYKDGKPVNSLFSN